MTNISFLQSRSRAAREGIGKPVLRKEDARLLVGGGCYSDDVNLPGQAYACFVRSPHAHARIGAIETAAALATPGVVAVLTGEDAAADGVKPIKHSPMPANAYEEARRGAYNPTYLYYTLGKLEIQEIAREYRSKKGATLKQFHDAFVRQGGLPIALVRKILFRRGGSP